MKLKTVMDGKLTEIDFPFENRKPTPQEEIAKLKQELEETDYKTLKYLEGWLTDEEYDPIYKQRQQLRHRINMLEQKL